MRRKIGNIPGGLPAAPDKEPRITKDTTLATSLGALLPPAGDCVNTEEAVYRLRAWLIGGRFEGKSDPAIMNFPAVGPRLEAPGTGRGAAQS